MTDQAILDLFRHLAAIYRRDFPEQTYIDICRCVTALSSEPFDRVWQVCLDEES